MSGVPKEYRGLMRDAMKGDKSEEQRPLKRRKKGKKVELPKIAKKEKVTQTQDASLHFEILDDDQKYPSSSKLNNKFPPKAEVVDLTSEDDASPEATPQPKNMTIDLEQPTPEPPSRVSEVKMVDDGDSGEDEFDDDDFEDVDLENVKPKASSMLTGDVVLTVEKKEELIKSKKKRMNVISKEERDFRKDFHRSYLACMMVHGFVRNQWCNRPELFNPLKKLLTVSIYEELHPSKPVKPIIKTRRFLDGLRHLMEKWNKYYKVTSNKGIFKHDWYDWNDLDRSGTNFNRFQRCIERGRGTRDIGAQGFVALLRVADVPARLVFSLQPPDFTNRQIKGEQQEKPKNNDAESSATSVRDKVIALRKGKVSGPKKTVATQAEIEMVYPVFWAEAWDSTSKTWYTLDPIMLNVIENVKGKSKLEPPLSHPYNQLLYVIGYDRMGGVRDITRRYAEKYYSKTRKKRITKEESEEIWYSGLIDTLNSRPPNRADQYEDEYFARRAEQEGMPDNIQDFKGHPFFVLESQLKSNEIIHPKESCGMLRVKGRNEAVQVYKRSDVKYLRSPRAWYQRGRILKAGAQPMKTRQKTSTQMSRNVAFADDDEDREERLYAEFQTELYVPPPATDGLIEKNAYGNIDVFVPSMIPEGAVLINTPYAEDAAKALGIDYAPAVVGFKFDRRQATPRMGGVVVGADFKEAMEVVEEQLKTEAEEKERTALEIRALKGWNLLLTKLRIKQRLDKSHGKLDEGEDANSEEEFEKLQEEYNEYVANNDDDDDDFSVEERSDAEDDDDEGGKPPSYGGAGFMADDAVWVRPASDDEVENTGAGGFVPETEDIGAGGFIGDEDTNGGFTGAGFVLDEEPVEAEAVSLNDHSSETADHAGGGFLIENDDDVYDPNDDGAIEASANGDLDDYEAFMEGLGDEYADDSGNEEDGADGIQEDTPATNSVVVIEDETPPYANSPITGNTKVSETLVSDSDSVGGGSAPPEEVIVSVPSQSESPSGEPPGDTELVASGPLGIGYTSFTHEPSPEVVPEEPVKQLDADEDLERQFNEQLEDEHVRSSSAEASESYKEDQFDAVEDDEYFEYESD